MEDIGYQSLQLEIGRFTGDLDELLQMAGHVSHNEYQYINWERRASILEAAVRHLRAEIGDLKNEQDTQAPPT